MLFSLVFQQKSLRDKLLNVDAVSGASVTLNGVLDGVARAVKQAGSKPMFYETFQHHLPGEAAHEKRRLLPNSDKAFGRSG